MKKRFFLGMLVISALILTSCLKDDDSYSLGKIWISLGETEVQENGLTVVRLDDGSLLFPAAGTAQVNLPDDGTRLLINYTIIGDKLISEESKEYYVRVNSWREVLKKGVIDLTEDIQDSIGNDPVVVDNIWVSSNQLLNIEFRYLGLNKVHYINLVKSPGTLDAEAQPIELEFRHNENGDDRVYTMNALVSFDLSALRISGLDEVEFSVKSVDYNDTEHIFKGTYRF